MFRKLKTNSLEITYAFSISLVAVLYLRKFHQMFTGYQYPTWGYSTYLVNYQGGFVRRGLPGELLYQLYRRFDLDPYYLLMTIYSILLTLILFFWIRFIRTFDPISRMILLLNPAFIVMPLSQDSSLLCKEWLIGTTLLIFAFVSHGKKIQRLSAVYYRIICIFIFIPMLTLLNLSHEEQFFLLPIYLYFYFTATYYGEKSNNLKIDKFLIPLLFILTQITSLYFVILHHGNFSQADKIIKLMPKSFGARDYIIQSMGWSLNKSVQMTNSLLQSPSTIFTFVMTILIGPVLIYFLITNSTIKKTILHSALLVPIFTLFIVGWDWGRWILLLTFSTISIAVFEGKAISKFKIHQKSTILTQIIMVAIFLASVMVKVPNCCVQPWTGFTTFDLISVNLQKLLN